LAIIHAGVRGALVALLVGLGRTWWVAVGRVLGCWWLVSTSNATLCLRHRKRPHSLVVLGYVAEAMATQTIRRQTISCHSVRVGETIETSVAKSIWGSFALAGATLGEAQLRQPQGMPHVAVGSPFTHRRWGGDPSSRRRDTRAKPLQGCDHPLAEKAGRTPNRNTTN